MADDIRLVSILGSTTKPGRLHRAINEALDRAAGRHAVSPTRIDLGEVNIGFADGTPLERLSDDTPAVVESVTAADAVLLATPVYRGSLTGSLKNLLDLTPIEALREKPVQIVAMGATDHHFLGAAGHMRDLLGFFGALGTPVDVYLNSRDFEDGVPSSGAAGLLDQAIDGLLDLTAALRDSGPLGPRPLLARMGGPKRR